MEVRCRTIYGLGREECVLAALPNAGDMVRSIGGQEFRVDQITLIENRREGDSHAVIFATRIERAKSA